MILSIVTSYTLAACPNGLSLVGNVGGGAVCEDFSSLNGSIQVIGGTADGVQLGKRVYYQGMGGTWGGLNRTDVWNAAQDLLAEKYLDGGRDPGFDEVLNTVPPILYGWGANAGFGYAGQHTFTSSRQSDVEIVFDHLGDVGMYAGYPRPLNIIGKEWATAQNTVYEGLVGGWLQIVHFVYQVNATVRWEMTCVPIDGDDGNREQAAMFRFVRISNGVLDKQIVFDTYSYNPAYTPTTTDFYQALVSHNSYWGSLFASSNITTFTIPNTVLHDQSLHSLAKDMITRRASYWPKYGVCGDPGGCAYGGPHNNGFPETFTATVMAAVEWGLFDYAKGVISNFLTYYIRPNGMLNYRGLEMAQHARILTVLGLYYQYSGDAATIAAQIQKIGVIIQLLQSRLYASRQLDRSDPAYGMPIGNDEADLWLDDIPLGSTEYPFYSIALETARGFIEISTALERVGNATLAANLTQEAKIIKSDFEVSMGRSVNGTCYPYVAGVGVCDELPNQKSIRDSEPWRTYSEMFYSNLLSKDKVQGIVKWNTENSLMTRIGALSGTGSDCCGQWIQTFTSHGYAFGLLQNDMVPEFLLQLYTISSHGYTRGTWTALEETSIEYLQGQPYCPPAQLSVPLSVKWMLLTDNSDEGIIYYGRGIPRDWWSSPTPITVTRGQTRYGPTTFSYTPTQTTVTFSATLPTAPTGYNIKLRLPPPMMVQSVHTATGTPLSFNTTTESVFLPSGQYQGAVSVVFYM